MSKTICASLNERKSLCRQIINRILIAKWIFKLNTDTGMPMRCTPHNCGDLCIKLAPLESFENPVLLYEILIKMCPLSTYGVILILA